MGELAILTLRFPKNCTLQFAFFKIGKLFLKLPCSPHGPGMFAGLLRDCEVAQAFLTVKKVLGPLRKLTDKEDSLGAHGRMLC